MKKSFNISKNKVIAVKEKNSEDDRFVDANGEDIRLYKIMIRNEKRYFIDFLK